MVDELAVGDRENGPGAPVGLAVRLAEVEARIARAARRAGREPAAITLVAVSKTHAAQAVASLAAAGQRDFGENRVEESVSKMTSLAHNSRLRWHMLGHVQSRKAGDVIRAGFDLVHSVDSLRLAGRLSRLAQESGRRQAVLLECNVSGESTKAGFRADNPANWPALLTEFQRLVLLPGLEVRGLMTMAPQVQRPELARPFFQRLSDLRDYLRRQWPAQSWLELSMGMTDDFEVAIEAGATLVRIGRAIFGERP